MAAYLGKSLSRFFLTFFWAPNSSYFAIISDGTARSCVVALAVIVFGVLGASIFFPELPFLMDNAASSPASDFLGLASAILTVAGYGAPLAVIGKVHTKHSFASYCESNERRIIAAQVISTRSVEFMPLPLTVHHIINLL